MAITSKDIISLSHARAKLTELCEEVHAKGSEKIITKNGAAVLRSSTQIGSTTITALNASTSTSVCCRKQFREWLT